MNPMAGSLASAPHVPQKSPGPEEGDPVDDAQDHIRDVRQSDR